MSSVIRITQEISNEVYRKLGGTGSFNFQKANSDPIARSVPIPYDLLDSWFITDIGIHIIKQFEGFIKHAMRDISNNGSYVVGYGIVTTKPNDTVTLEEGEQRLKKALPRYVQPVIDLSKKRSWYISTNMFDALTDYSYNAGPGKMNKMCSKCKDVNDVYNAFLKKASTTPIKLKGVKRRRLVDAKLCMNMLEETDLKRGKTNPMPDTPSNLTINIDFQNQKSLNANT